MKANRAASERITRENSDLEFEQLRREIDGMR